MNDFLLVNPYIYDFSCYDLWMKPLGLLCIANILKKCNCEVSIIDCMDRHHPDIKKKFFHTGKYGCGHYYREEVEKPEVLSHIPRKYKRHGFTNDILISNLKNSPKPELILVTSGMTYWYNGAFDVIEIIKDIYPDVPIILGGTYATLCGEHAKQHSKADYVFSGGDVLKLIELINNLIDKKIDLSKVPKSFIQYPEPWYGCYSEPEYVCLRTSVGCVFNCKYCAVNSLSPKFLQKDYTVVSNEIEFFYNELKVRNFAFYDDALLVNADKHIMPILKNIIRKNIKAYFHTPNGLHIRFITQELAELMHGAGFINPRLSLETVNRDIQKSTGNKVTTEELVCAIEHLTQAGYKSDEIIVYIIVGLPGQPDYEVVKSIDFLNHLGVKISLSEFSPVPTTLIYKKIYGESAPSGDYLTHNNTIFTDRSTLDKLKLLARFADYGTHN